MEDNIYWWVTNLFSTTLRYFCQPVVKRDDGGETTREDSEAGYAEPEIASSLHPNERTTVSVQM